MTWPAASPLVIAVGASELASNAAYDGLDVAGYSNVGGGVDFVAPGGNVETDIDGDGIVDGLLGQAIDPKDPTQVGYWLMAGTSQAAALTTGTAAEFLGAGIAPDEIRFTLQLGGRYGDFEAGLGRGFVDFDWRVRVGKVEQSFFAALLPFLGAEGSGASRAVRPKGRVAVFDASGAPAVGVTVVGSIWGNGDSTRSCVTDTNGICTIAGEAVAAPNGVAPAMAWSFAVETIVASGYGFPPQAALTVTPEFDQIVGAMDATPGLENALLAFSFSDSVDDRLGPVANCFSITDSGSGLKSIPLGLLMTEDAADDLGDTHPETVGVAGHAVPVLVLTLDGTGLASIPLGLVDAPVFAFLDGTGLKSIPLGFDPTDPYGDGDPVGLDDPAQVSGTHLKAKLATGGWTSQGYAGASLLGSSSSLGIAPAQATMLDGLGHGSVPFRR